MSQHVIPYGRQSISDEDIQAVIEVLKSDYLTQGPSITAFENAFAEYVDAKYAIAVSNGTTALHLCALALGVTKGTKVITTPITFVASANCVKYCEGEVYFADIDPTTFLIDVEKVRILLEASPKGTYSGIIPVDFAGYPVNTEELRKLANEYGLWIIEDACHAPGGSFTDTKGNVVKCGNGQYADLTVFSFHPVKHIACGEGGMITTNNKELYEELLLLRTHGITKDSSKFKNVNTSINSTLNTQHSTLEIGGWYYEMQSLGYNYRLSDMQAALGLSQLKRADTGVIARNAIAQKYDTAFSALKGITIPFRAENFYHAFHLYVIQVEDRLGLYNYLKENGIYAQVHYVPVHTMPYFQTLGSKIGDNPIAENYYAHCLSLPMFPTLTEVELDFVIANVLEFIKA
jgi:UDP-4-amino-4,6-dideoxy-N-acetyl-beta-L-altrosamine transaminase